MSDNVKWLEGCARAMEDGLDVEIEFSAEKLHGAAAEITRLREHCGKLTADLYGTQDGALLRDLQFEIARLRTVDAALREPSEAVIDAVATAIHRARFQDENPPVASIYDEELTYAAIKALAEEILS